ncbi:hypothetical protein [Cellvibrio fibrivorans]|uniref:LPXTG cell wall anchor domain-containing protein n=1 Tax=Cellvibrio fibrivorans TaxID=126350 RepID=A0ABU1UZI7_9GAMM|nr:hypothetical protein [Cellvibrio fibrivorans]MDR7090617.1 hypothetical protein [Cellvibrio fibrivorans]
MLNHSLMFLALISFSIVSSAAAIPMDADLAAVDATPNAVLHKDYVILQGGDVDKDVAEALADVDVDAAPAKSDLPAVSDWFAVRDDEGGLQSLALLMLLIGLGVFFLSRKSSSTK